MCLPAYNLYTAELPVHGCRGQQHVFLGPSPPRKRFDTHTSSDEENQDDEPPELEETESECDEEDEHRRAPDPVASTEDDIAADDDDDADSSIGKKRKAPNKKRVFVPQKSLRRRGIWISTTPPMFMLLFASNSVKSILKRASAK